MKIIMLFQFFLLINFSILFPVNEQSSMAPFNQSQTPVNQEQHQGFDPSQETPNTPFHGKVARRKIQHGDNVEETFFNDSTQNIQGLHQFRFTKATLNKKELDTKTTNEIAECFEVLDRPATKTYELRLDRILSWGCQTDFVINKVLANKNIMEYEKMKEILEQQKKEFDESLSAEHPAVKVLLKGKENKHEELLNKKEKEHEDSFNLDNPKIKTIIENNRSVFEKHRSKIFFGLITTTMFATHFYVSPKILVPTFSMFERAFRAIRESGSVPA